MINVMVGPPHRGLSKASRRAVAVAGAAVLAALLAAPWAWLTGDDQLTARTAAGSETGAPAAFGFGPGRSEELSQHAVGITTLTLVDETRGTPARGSSSESSSRTLTVTIRYPATGTVGSDEVVDGEAARGRFPLVVLVHGFAAWAEMYHEMSYELAAAGFIVVAPDFPVSSAALEGSADRDPVEQALDVSFVISSLRADPPAPLQRSVAGTKVGVIGQSDGGITAAGIAFNDEYRDERVGAAVVLTGAEIFFPGSWFSDPTAGLLAIHGTADETNPFGASQQLFADAAGTARYLVGVIGGSHNGPFTDDPIRPRVSAIIASFLWAQLRHDDAAAARIPELANVPGELELVAAD